MRILYFSRAYTTHDRHFLEAIAAGHQVSYLRLHFNAVSYESRKLPAGVEEMEPLCQASEVSKPEEYLRVVPRFKTAVAHARPDVVHAGPVPSCAFIAAQAGFHPLLAMSWGSDLLVDALRDADLNYATRYTLHHCDMLATDCDEVSLAAKHLAGVGQENIVQFPWGVDIAVFRPGDDTSMLRSRLGWENCRVAISTRSFEPIYGVLPLLQGFAMAFANEPRLRLVLAGDGSLRAEVKQMISTYGLTDVVWLAGAVPHDELPDYFRAADFYVSFAKSDGSSISLLEAMATGLPVIATDRASNREWVDTPSSGTLVPFEDVKSMAAGLLAIATIDETRRREIAVHNRAIVETKADWRRNVKRLMLAYDALAGSQNQVTT